MNREAAFLSSTFNEFYKCWRSGANARLFIESVRGKAFVNFSAFLGNPDDVHFNPRQSKRHPSKPRKKSAKKIKRDNDRAARFQERKKKEEEEAASASKPLVKNPEDIEASSPGLESVMTISDQEFSFSFASPVPEVLRHDEIKDTSMVLSDKKELGEHKVQKVQKAPNVGNYLNGVLVKQAPGLTSLTRNLKTNGTFSSFWETPEIKAKIKDKNYLKSVACQEGVQELLQKRKGVNPEYLVQSQNRK